MENIDRDFVETKTLIPAGMVKELCHIEYFESFIWWPKLRLKCCKTWKWWFSKEEKHQRDDSRAKRNKDGKDWNELEMMILKSLANFFNYTWTVT